jgi:hypothetical protein
MTRSIGLALLAAGAIASAGAIGSATHGVAQDGLMRLAEIQKGRSAPRQVAPRQVAPRPAPRMVAPRSAPRPAAPRMVAPNTMAPKTFSAPKTVTPRPLTGSRTVAPKTFTGQRTVAPRTLAAPGIGQRTVAPRQVVLPRGVGPRRISGPGFRAIGPRRTGRIILGGRNYTVWRGGHRFRHGGRWATLAAIGALGLIVYSGASYYPYAYVSAPVDTCEGLTEDGCVMQWQEVPTEEGYTVPQCVAYCPWQ